MRKRRIWILVGVVVLALGVALTQLPEATPYDFLRGREPVKFVPAVRRDTFSRFYQGEIQVYTFKADFGATRDEAYRDVGLARVMLVTGNPAGLIGFNYRVQITRGPEQHIEVTLFEDGKVASATYDRSSNHLLDVAYAKDWVTVVIEGKVERTWFDNLGAWLGL